KLILFWWGPMVGPQNFSMEETEMRNDSRIRISGLSEDTAVKLMSVLRRYPLLKGGTLELDHPDPPDLLEDEYIRVNNIFTAIQEAADWEYYDMQKKSEVVKDISALRKHRVKIEKLSTQLGEAIDKLEAGLQKLP